MKFPSFSSRHARGGSAEMLAVALPMVVSLSCDTVMTFTDRWFLSRVDVNLMNAAFAGGVSAFVVQTFFIGLIGYTTALVAQEYGAGHPERCRRAGVQALWVALLAWPLLLLCIPLAHWLFPRLGLPAEQVPPLLVFFDLLVGGSVLGLARGALSGYFSGLGRTRVVMVASLAAMVSNVGLSWVLIFGRFGLPALGIVGAAIGTLCASGIALGILLAAWFRLPGPRVKERRDAWRIDPGLMGELLRKGTPSGAEFILNMSAFQCMILLFQRQGADSATAATIVFNWDMVSFVPLVGIEIGTTSLVGRYIGARQFAAVRRALGSGMRLGWTFSAVVLAAFLLFPGVLVNVFRPETSSALFEGARGLSVNMVRIASVYIGVEAVLLVYAGALRGSGDTFWVMGAMVAMHWTLVAAQWVTLEVLHLGSLAAWGVLVVSFLFFPLVLGLRWRRGLWRTRPVAPGTAADQPRSLDLEARGDWGD